MSLHEDSEVLTPANMTPEEIETAAYRSGWRPLEEFRGNPDQWVDAATFLERGEAILPIVRRQLREERDRNGVVTRELTELKTKVQDQELTMREVLEMARRSEGRGYERAKRELEARQREAVASGDVTAFDETKDALAELETERAPKAVAPPPPKPAPANVAPEVTAWVAENPWFTTDATLNAAMNAEHVRLKEEAPGLSLTDNLEQAKQAVMERYPAKFGIRTDPQPNPPRTTVAPRHNTVQRPTAPAGPRGVDTMKIDSIQDPDERVQARQAFERQKRHMPGFTERDYMLLYNDPKADVLVEVEDKRRVAK